MNTNEPPILYNEEAEQAVIGSVLISQDLRDYDDLHSVDFYVQRHRWIWDAIKALDNRKIDIDVITLSDELDKCGRLAEVGGPMVLTKLINYTPSSLYGASYAKIVKEYAYRRSLINAAQDIAKIAYNSKNVETDVIEIVERLSKRTSGGDGAEHWAGAIGELYDEVEERSKNPKDVWGIPTGIKDFDAITGGLQPGEVLLLGGEPGIGKSKLSLQMGVNMGLAGHPGAIYSLEMRKRQVTRRAISSIGKIDTRKMKSGRMESTDWTAFTQAVELASEAPIFLCDAGNLTTAKLRADLARLVSREKIEWFVLDYLFLMADGDGTISDNERTAMLSRRLKNMALDFGLAGITVSSVTKEGMGGENRPTQKNIRGSGQMIHDADMVCFLTNHIAGKFEAVDKRLVTLSFAKGRDLEGSKGYFHLVKFDTYPSFGDYAPGGLS